VRRGCSGAAAGATAGCVGLFPDVTPTPALVMPLLPLAPDRASAPERGEVAREEATAAATEAAEMVGAARAAVMAAAMEAAEMVAATAVAARVAAMVAAEMVEEVWAPGTPANPYPRW